MKKIRELAAASRIWFFCLGVLIVVALIELRRSSAQTSFAPANTNLFVLQKPVAPVAPSAAAATQKPTPPSVEFPAERFSTKWNTNGENSFSAFTHWTETYLHADADTRTKLLEQGIALARQRRDQLSELIEKDPRQAIALAVTMTVRSQLPQPIIDQLEENVSGVGQLSLAAVTPAPGQTITQPYFRTAAVNGKFYRAFVYGRREQQTTKVDISLLGIALDGKLAVSDSPLRVLEPGEVPPPDKPITAVCPVSGQVTPIDGGKPLNLTARTAVEVGGKIIQLCSAGHVISYEGQLINAEDAAGPYSGALKLGDTGPGTANIAGRPPISWSQGPKKVLLIRVDFPDKPGQFTNPTDGQIVTEDYVVNRFNSANGVKDFYVQGSYNKTTLTMSPTISGDSPDVTQMLRLSNSSLYYATNGFNDQLHFEARTLAANAGYAVSNYDFIGVAFPYLGGISNSAITYGGLALVQGNQFWVNGHFTFGIVAHEIGHNYGLKHANLWKVTDGNPVSPNGTSVEYGDLFDVMGSLNLLSTYQFHFNHWEKSLLQWIPDSAVTTVNTSGTYRVYRFDHQNANLTNALALKLVRDRGHDYWIGMRQALTTNASLMNGAYVLWGYNQLQQSDLLDMTTPNTNAFDAALPVSTTFTDAVAGITIKPLAKGGTTPNEYLDVQIGFASRIRWSTTNYTFDEQLGVATLTLSRSGSSSGAVTVFYASTNGTAVAPGDYTAASGSVTWTNGDTTDKTISIPLVADATVEGVEYFNVRITNITGGVVVDGSNAVVNIAEPGGLDVSLAQEFINGTVEQMAVQPDGKLLLVGWFSTNYYNGSPYIRNGFSRLNADGSLDVDFGNGSGANTSPVYGLALQNDGKILIGGGFSSVHGIARAAIARLNSDGSVDPTFNPGVGPNGTVRSIAVQPDGKIVIGGDFTAVQGVAREYVARLNSDGSLDTTFVGPDFGSTGGWSVCCVALQPDNKILAGGVFYFPSSQFKAGIVRMNTNGATDLSFDPGAGAHTAGTNNQLQRVRCIAVQGDGTMIIGGDFSGYNNTNRNYLAKISSTGVLDTNFNPLPDAAVYAALIQPDGKIIIGGQFTSIGGASLKGFARINPNGTTDTSFDVGSGFVGFFSPSGMRALALQPDGKIVMGSDFGTIKGVASRTVTRFYTGLPALPGTLQIASTAYTALEGSSAVVSVTRKGGSYGAVSINYATIPGSATASDFTPSFGTLSWTNGESTAKNISIPVISDGVVENDELFIVNLGIPIGGAFLNTPGYANVTITTSYKLWKQTYFNASELLDAQTSGDNADPDGDGIPNILEYAANTNPRSANTATKPLPQMLTVNGTNYLTLSLRRNSSALDLSFIPQAAGALSGTFTNGPVVLGAPINNLDGTETVTWRDTVAVTNAAQRFMRLQINQVP